MRAQDAPALRDAALDGDKAAAAKLGDLYIQQNLPVQAVQWHSRAAQLGQSTSQLILARFLRDGRGGG